MSRDSVLDPQLVGDEIVPPGSAFLQSRCWLGLVCFRQSSRVQWKIGRNHHGFWHPWQYPPRRPDASGNNEVETPDEVFYRRYLGGAGFVAYYLLKEVAPGTDPLGPENRLIFACGPLTGAPLAGSGRNAIGAHSPLTGALGESDVGGFWGAELKAAGFDAIVVQGRSASPVYLWVHNGEAELRDAGHLWGQENKETHTAIREELGEPRARVALCGPAGENLVRLCQHRGRPETRGRSHRPGRGHGLQEPESHRRARPKATTPGRP